MKVEGPGQTISSNGPGVNELAAGAVFAKKRDAALPGPGINVKARLLENVFYQFLLTSLTHSFYCIMRWHVFWFLFLSPVTGGSKNRDSR